MLLIKAVILSLTISSTNAHMLLKNSPNFGFTENTLSTKPDVDLDAPVSKAQFSCKGYHKDHLRGAGGGVATWAAGSTQAFSVSGGGAPHGDSSYQISLSYDNGETFKVMKSFTGNCLSTDTNRECSFPVPRDAAGGPAVFAWTWYNKQSNREMYIYGIAAVTITNSGSGIGNLFPRIFVAGIGERALLLIV
ncbi:unnamed protein product [Tuber aestivum]|uniref:Uncharacterized protein n=1 Tax=Tuber aestivum TaxID=59557 RepID=A0A292PX44_9PEZI|nr:unnamed protein product [Tuber aestivum]